jgi:hypothetical protein
MGDRNETVMLSGVESAKYLILYVRFVVDASYFAPRYVGYSKGIDLELVSFLRSRKALWKHTLVDSHVACPVGDTLCPCSGPGPSIQDRVPLRYRT